MTVDISLRSCAFTAGANTILHALDLQIPAAETVVLLGSSGCGKTTLLRLISGLIFPDEGGQILFSGKDVTRVPIERRNVGMVFQNYALFPNMTVRGNIDYGLKVRRISSGERKARVGEMLKMMHLEALADRPVQALSGGQRQRVALARAIAPKPDVLLLDEPLSALDPSLRDKVRSEIDSTLRSLGTTTIYVSHDQQEAMLLADRIILLDKGRIAQSGTPQDIWMRPATAWVARFLGGGIVLSAQGTAAGWTIEGELIHLDIPVVLGRTVDILVRPEAVLPTPPGTQGTLSCCIESVRYMGDRLRLKCQIRSTSLSVDIPPEMNVQPGPAGLRLQTERLVLLP